MLERRLSKSLHLKILKQSRLLRSKRAFAIPVTYMILFASLIALISVTYSFAIVKISARGATLRASVARQNMRTLDDSVHSVAWSFGASEVIYMDDCGGVFKTATTAKSLVLNLTDERTVNSLVFNSPVGEAFYELEPSESSDYGLYMRGDDRAIINRTSSSMTQLYVTAGASTQNVVLCYRPLATVAYVGATGNKPLNVVRVNIMNFNCSQSLTLREKFYLRATSTNVATVTNQYLFNGTISSLALKATYDGRSTTVWLPLASNAEGAVVDLEVTVCSVKLQQVEG